VTAAEYLSKIDELICGSPGIISIDVIRRSIWTTEVETIGMYRYKIVLDNGDLLELTERIVEKKGELSVIKYRHHWQQKDGTIINRWDNAPHYRNVDTFPHHLHEGSETNIISHPEINGFEVLNIVLSMDNSKKSNSNADHHP
jgi:hypothetical protein